MRWSLINVAPLDETVRAKQRHQQPEERAGTERDSSSNFLDVDDEADEEADWSVGVVEATRAWRGTTSGTRRDVGRHEAVKDALVTAGAEHGELPETLHRRGRAASFPRGQLCISLSLATNLRVCVCTCTRVNRLSPRSDGYGRWYGRVRRDEDAYNARVRAELRESTCSTRPAERGCSWNVEIWRNYRWNFHRRCWRKIEKLYNTMDHSFICIFYEKLLKSLKIRCFFTIFAIFDSFSVNMTGVLIFFFFNIEVWNSEIRKIQDVWSWSWKKDVVQRVLKSLSKRDIVIFETMMDL